MSNKASEAVIQRIRDMTAKKGPIGLKRMRRLLVLLGHPEEHMSVVHVAGTNGKGSVYGLYAASSGIFRRGIYFTARDGIQREVRDR